MLPDLETIAAGFVIRETPDGVTIELDQGYVIAHDADRLAAHLPRHSVAAAHLRRHPSVTTLAIGPDVIEFTFPAAMFADLVAILRPRRRPSRALRHRFPAGARP